MSNEISTAKAEFKTDLALAGLTVLEYIPDRIVPPIVLINAASPYIQTAEFGEFHLNLELVLVAATATNKQATEKLDELIANTLTAVSAIAYAHLRKENAAGQPYALQVNNAEYLAANIYLQLAITL